MDPITDVFKTLHVRAVVHSRLEATAPWGLRHSPAEADSKAHHEVKNVTPSELAHFGMLARGNCWLTLDGKAGANIGAACSGRSADPIPLTGGDCFLLAPGHAYALRDNPGTSTKTFCEAARPTGNVIHYGGGGAPTTIISGWFRFDKPSLRPLAQLLPGLILIKADQAQTLALHTTMQMLASEMAEQQPGSEVIVDRLAEILFIQTIRAYIASGNEECKRGWLRASFDPQIGLTLKSIHENVNGPWTVESLAESAGMSRSSFAARFKELLGQTPLEYVTEWRMQKAIQFLQLGDKKLVDVAQSVGYESDAAFSKAFKRVLGVTPGEYRRNENEARQIETV